MRTDRRYWGWQFVALAVMALATSGCQDKDVGQPCSPSIRGTGGAELPACTDPALDVADYFESGPNMVGCDNLICVHSAKQGCTSGALNGKCSKPCVSDDDCFKSDTGMVCRQVILSDAYINILQKTPSGQELLKKYLQEIGSSYYCAVP